MFKNNFMFISLLKSAALSSGCSAPPEILPVKMQVVNTNGSQVNPLFIHLFNLWQEHDIVKLLKSVKKPKEFNMPRVQACVMELVCLGPGKVKRIARA